MKKKILSLVLVAAMLASMLVFAPTAGAATDAKVTVDVAETAGFKGDTVTVDVVITMDGEFGNLEAAQGAFTFDDTRLELVDRTRGDIWDSYSGTPAGEYDKSIFEEYVSDSVKSVCAYGGTEDATEGLAAFTLTFKIKDDAPAGEAEISFLNLGYITRVGNTDVAFCEEEDVAYLAGKVTVLDGSAPAIDPSEFEYVDNGDETCTVVEYLGTASVVTIPSEIDGLTVTGIGSMIFCDIDHDTLRYELESGKLNNNNAKYREGVTENYTATAVIIPATVTSIGYLAFAQAYALQTIVVLGDALESVDPTAFGYIGGSWYAGSGGGATNRGKYKEDAWPVGIPDETGEDVLYDDNGCMIIANLTLVQTVEGSLTEDYDAYLGVGYEEDGAYMAIERKYIGTVKTAELTLTIGDETVAYTAFGAAITAPAFEGVIGWAGADGNFYAPGAELGDVIALTAVAPANSVTAKITDEFAMRFEATFTKAQYDEMAALGEVTMGMLITPRQYVLKAGNVFTMEALDAFVAGTGYAGYVKVDVASAYSAIDANGAATKNFADCVAFNIAGSLTGIKESTAAKNPDFVAVGFMQVTTEGGETVTLYSNYSALNSMKISTFLETVNTDGLGATELGWINAWKNLFN